MSIEVIATGNETEILFWRNKDIKARVRPDDKVNECLPYLYMRSRGAAAQLLSDSFWLSDGVSNFVFIIACLFASAMRKDFYDLIGIHEFT